VGLRIHRAFFALTAAGYCACALETSGLLDIADAGDGGPSADVDVGGDMTLGESAAADGLPSTDAGGDSSGEGGQGADTSDGNGQGADASDGGTTTTAADADARADVAADGFVQATSDGNTDAPADGLADGAADAPADATADVVADSGPWPILWNGGAIADPLFVQNDWVNFCVTLVACGEMPSISACIALQHQPSSPDALIPPYDPIVHGVNTASPNCGQVATVLGDGSMCPRTSADACSGNSLVTCRWGFKMTIDCGRLGMVCSNGNGNAGCGFGDCAGWQEGSTFCAGPYVVQCKSGRYIPLQDCQTFGATCVGPDGIAQCRGNGMRCMGGPTCGGASIVACMQGHTASADCSALYDPSFACVMGNGAVPTCAAGQACDPASYVDMCGGGNQVDICNAGATLKYNCRVNSWGACASGHCVP
jgi:hypothetical protein